MCVSDTFVDLQVDIDINLFHNDVGQEHFQGNRCNCLPYCNANECEEINRGKGGHFNDDYNRGMPLLANSKD